MALAIGSLLSPLWGPLARAGEEVEIDGRLHIRNPAEPPQGIQRITLEKLWQAGGEDEELLLGLPTRVVAGPEGRIHVLDAQLNQVHVFSPDGALLATHFREGDGPGEIRNPSDLLVTGDGTMGVLQEYPGKVVRIDRAGTPLPSVFIGGDAENRPRALLMSGSGRGENLTLCGMQVLGSGEDRRNRQFLAAFDPDGSEIVAHVEVVEARDRSAPPSERDLLKPYILGWDVGADSRVYVAMSWDRYEIWVFNGIEGFERVIEREYEPWMRTSAEKERLQAMFSAGGGDPSMTLEVSETAPTIAFYQRGVQVADNRELWVLPSRGNRGLPDGVLARYDVFDPQGHFQRQVEFVCDGDPWNDRLIIIGDDRVIRIRRFVDALVTSLGPGGLPPVEEGAEEEIPAVICYRMR
jgi:hypothetical protein